MSVGLLSLVCIQESQLFILKEHIVQTALSYFKNTFSYSFIFYKYERILYYLIYEVGYP